METKKYPEAESLNCCQAFHCGMYIHGLHLDYKLAIPYYENAMTGDHPPAGKFLDWIKTEKPLANLCTSEDFKWKIDDLIKEIEEGAIRFGEEERRTIQLFSELARNYDLETVSGWHTVRMLFDLNSLGYSKKYLKEAVQEVGPIYNKLDSHGCLEPGIIEFSIDTGKKGWANLQGARFALGKVEILGDHSSLLPPIVMEEDVDVALALVFLPKDGPESPSLSLEPFYERSEGFRLDKKVFKPKWIAQTSYGQSLYFADWLMKSLTMRDSLPSLLDPTVCLGMTGQKQSNELINSVLNATGEDTLPDGSKSDSGRLEIIVNSVDLRRSFYKKFLILPIKEYTFRKINLTVDSSLIKVFEDGTEDRTIRENDPTTRPGARAKIIQDNYDEFSTLFPVFERVKNLLALFSLFCQARKDGVRLNKLEMYRLEKIRQKYLDLGYPKCDASPKPFHNNGCSCNGGVSGRQKANIVEESNKPEARAKIKTYSKIEREEFERGENKVYRSTMRIKPDALYAREKGNKSGALADAKTRKQVRIEKNLHYDRADLFGSEVAFHIHSLLKGADPEDSKNVMGGSFYFNIGIWKKMEEEVSAYVKRTGIELVEVMETTMDSSREGVIRDISVKIINPIDGTTPQELIQYTKNLSFVNFGMAKSRSNN